MDNDTLRQTIEGRFILFAKERLLALQTKYDNAESAGGVSASKYLRLIKEVRRIRSVLIGDVENPTDQELYTTGVNKKNFKGELEDGMNACREVIEKWMEDHVTPID
jgi:hypothetical protein